MRPGLFRGRCCGILGTLKPLRLEFHLLTEEIPFLAQSLGRILSQHRQPGSRVGQAAAKAGGQSIQRRLHQGLRCAHGRPGRGRA